MLYIRNIIDSYLNLELFHGAVFGGVFFLGGEGYLIASDCLAPVNSVLSRIVFFLTHWIQLLEVETYLMMQYRKQIWKTLFKNRIWIPVERKQKRNQNLIKCKNRKKMQQKLQPKLTANKSIFEHCILNLEN